MAISSLPSRAPRLASKGIKVVSSTSSDIFHSRLIPIETSLSSSSDLNPLYDLIKLIDEQSEKESKAPIITLQRAIKFLIRSFQVLLSEHKIPLTQVDSYGFVQGVFPESIGQSEAEQAVSSWLRQRWNEAVQLLCKLLLHEAKEIRVLALSSLMSLQRDASSQLHLQLASSSDTHTSQWSSSPWLIFMHTLIAGDDTHKTPAEDVVSTFAEEYLNQYDDVRYCFCKEVDRILRSPPSHLVQHQYLRTRAIENMWGLTAIPSKQEDLNTFLVKGLQEAEVPKKSNKKAASKAEVEDGQDEDGVEDWFSDSDDENQTRQPQASNVNGLGKAAQIAGDASRVKRQRKKNPPFSEAVLSLNVQKAAFSRAWLAILFPIKKKNAEGTIIVLGGSLTLASMHETLVRMHSQILPHLVKPNLLHDFLVDCLEAGGATSLLALNALFSLMTTHNLNYPSFYTRLYSLLLSDPPFLHVRYRSRFLRLLDTFLSSTHLPAALIASFAKRLSRAALRAPPAAIVVVIPFVWNLCKRHKRCLGLLHREFGGDRFDAGPAGMTDPFDSSESDPLKTGAIDSSLWELSAMGATLSSQQQTSLASISSGGDAHYLANVSSLSKILAEPFTKERYDLEDFLDLTHATMFETESAKTLKRRPGKKVVEPALVYALPNRNGKRMPLFGDIEDGSSNVKKARVERDHEEEQADYVDVEIDNARGAIQEQQEASRSQYDACNRLFTFR